MITIFTPVHGRPDLVFRCCEAIDRCIQVPFQHLVVDDFSLPEDFAALSPLHSEVRQVVPASICGATKAPSMGETLGWAWALASHTEGLLIVESDVIIHPTTLERLREAVESDTGAVAPLFTKVGENTIDSFGGMTTEDLAFAGHRLGEPINEEGPQVTDTLWWAHLACLWVPAHTLRRGDVNPDPQFTLYYQDHDITRQMRETGLKVLLADKAVAEHTRANNSVGVMWKEQQRQVVEAKAYKQLWNKWRKLGVKL